MTSKKDQDEEKRAVEQFDSLRQPANFRDPPRTPAQLWSGIRDAAALAKLCSLAMLPQFQFTRGIQQDFRLEASILGEPTVLASKELVKGSYEFRGLRGPQSIELRPADRVLLDARKRDNKFELSLPTYGFELARKYGNPHATTGTAATAGIHATIPRLVLDSDSHPAKRSLRVTLDPIGQRGRASVSAVTGPSFACLDVKYADGNRPKKD